MELIILYILLGLITVLGIALFIYYLMNMDKMK